TVAVGSGLNESIKKTSSLSYRKAPMLLFDGHLDLSMNAIEWNRDITKSIDEVRRREAGQTDKVDRGQNVCTFPEMRRGKMGLCIATQIARYVGEGNPLPGWRSSEIAWSI